MPIFYCRSVVLLALLVPVFALSSVEGGTIVIYATALISLFAMAANAWMRWESFNFLALSPIILSLLAPLVAMLISGICIGLWSASEIEKLLRFALAVPVCWLLLRAPRVWLLQIQWSLLLGAYIGASMLLVILNAPDLGRSAVADFGARYNAVTFADMTMLFGLSACLTLPWTLSRWPRAELALKIGALCITLVAVWMSGTRSSWALCVVLGLVYALGKQNWTAWKKLLFVGGLGVALLAGGWLVWHLQDTRWNEVASDVSRYTTQGDRNTSVGIRLQLWHASWLMFMEHPLTGIGASNFRAELAELAKHGVVTELVAQNFGEPHNDFLGALSSYGVLGFLSMLSVYLVPAGVFLRRLLRSQDVITRVSAQLGLLYCLGYCVFSFSEMMFRNMRSVPAYAIPLVVLYALSAASSQRPVRVKLK